MLGMEDVILTPEKGVYNMNIEQGHNHLYYKVKLQVLQKLSMKKD